MRSFIAVVMAIVLAGCASTSTKDLTQDTSQQFELKNGYASSEHLVVNRLGRPLEIGVNLCQGVYQSTYRDAEGTYFKSMNNCHVQVCAGKMPCMSTGPGGIWIPDDKNRDHYEIWLPVGRTVGNGLLVDALDAVEVGNYKRMSLYLRTDAVLNEINASTVKR